MTKTGDTSTDCDAESHLFGLPRIALYAKMDSMKHKWGRG